MLDIGGEEQVDAGQLGCRRGGMQDKNDADRRDREQEGCRTEGMQDRRDTGQERCWTGEMLYTVMERCCRMDTSRMGYKIVWMQDWTDAEME